MIEEPVSGEGSDIEEKEIINEFKYIEDFIEKGDVDNLLSLNWEEFGGINSCFLIRPDAERMQKKITPLMLACFHNQSDVVQALVEQSQADVNASSPEDGHTALHTATIKGSQTIVEYLLSKNADPNAEERWHGSAAHIAVIYNHLPILETLKIYDANFKIKDDDDDTPMDIAKFYKKEKFLEFLIQFENEN